MSQALYVCPSGRERGYATDENAYASAPSCAYADLVASLSGVHDLHDVAEGHDWNEAQYAAHVAAQVREVRAGWECVTRGVRPPGTRAAQAYVSVQGGPAIIASLFGGTNLVYDTWPRSEVRRVYARARVMNVDLGVISARSAQENQHEEYTTFFNTFSNASIAVATSHAALMRLVHERL